jgi:glucose-6-phosphate 1-epimerase
MNKNKLEQLEIPGRVKIAAGNGGLTKVIVTSDTSTAEIYLLGAHVTHFQKTGEPPLLFISTKSYFMPGKAIRGGVPVCFPWFGPRDGDAVHGFARITEWQLEKTTVAGDGAVTLKFRLPEMPAHAAWKNLHTELMVTVSDKLTMKLVATNKSAATLEIENCLHTYFQVGDIDQVSITGLQDAPFDNFAAGAGGARKVESESALRIAKETNRVYLDTSSAVEIRDEILQRTIRVEKSGSRSTVVWNPWTTQKLPDDFDPAEYRQMVCVESGNVKQNNLSLSPGAAAALTVVFSTKPI